MGFSRVLVPTDLSDPANPHVQPCHPGPNRRKRWGKGVAFFRLPVFLALVIYSPRAAMAPTRGGGGCGF